MGGVASHQIILLEHESQFSRVPMYDEGIAVRDRRQPAKTNGLEIRVVVAGGFDAHLLELCTDVIRSKLVATRTRGTAFKEIVGEERHVSADTVRSDAIEQLSRGEVGTGAG